MVRWLVLFFAAVLPACEFLARVDCDCDSRAITLELPSPDGGGAVDRVTASGPGCDDVAPVCDRTTCLVPANGEGACQVIVTYQDGGPPFVVSLTIGLTGTSSCCYGYASSGDASVLRVPEPAGDF
jgi:hypothetical protein